MHGQTKARILHCLSWVMGTKLLAGMGSKNHPSPITQVVNIFGKFGLAVNVKLKQRRKCSHYMMARAFGWGWEWLVLGRDSISLPMKDTVTKGCKHSTVGFNKNVDCIHINLHELLI